VLLVEDNEAARRGLAKLLEARGFDVTTVRDGASALRALETCPPPDYLLTDLRLPDLDGREVALRARQLIPDLRTGLITGWDLEPDQDIQATWGIDWVLHKPVDLQVLIQKLNEPPPDAPGGA
jgi:CheY-like chemotaxis protein